MKRNLLYGILISALVVAVYAYTMVDNVVHPAKPPVEKSSAAPATIAKRTLTIAGRSMAPTFQPGDSVEVMQTTGYAPERGDLVMIKFATSTRPKLKRVIAVSGDRFEIIDGRLKIGDDWLDTPWWPQDKRLAEKSYRLLKLQLTRYRNILPAATYVVMGDNSGNSFDSGDFGLVARGQITGRVRALK